VHRDVSPLNVFVTFAGQTKVLDFGIAKAIDSSQETKMGVLKGRIAYMAPEQAKGARVDRRADIYSAGVMLWEAVSGRRFWAGCTEVEILTELLHERSRPLRSVCPQAPADLDRICSRAMAYHREHRYATAAELLHDLEDHLAHRRDAMSMREVSALVGTAFADERAKMNALIDEALSRVRGAPRSGVMPVVPAHLSGAATFTNIASEELAKPTVRLFTPGQSFSPSGISSLGSLSRSAPITSAIQPSPQPPPRVRNWSIRSGMLALACAGALVLGILFGGKLASREREVVAPSGAVPRVAPAKSLSEADLVDIAVRVSPPAAQIAIDGAPVANNPYHARHPKDDRIHHIVASADGYETRMEDVSFATDVSIDVSLSRRALNPPMQPQPQSAPVSAVAPPRAQIAKRPTPAPTASSAAISQAAPTAPPASPRIEVPSTGGRSPFRPISTANPYVSP
jgi:serine/threonine-protein kinase